MNLREIKQHHIAAKFFIVILFLIDTFSIYLSYIIVNKSTLENIKLEFPFIIYFVIILLVYLFKNYNPSPRISRLREVRKIIQSIYVLGIFYTLFRIYYKYTF